MMLKPTVITGDRFSSFQPSRWLICVPCVMAGPGGMACWQGSMKYWKPISGPTAAVAAAAVMAVAVAVVPAMVMVVAVAVAVTGMWNGDGRVPFGHRWAAI